MRFLYEDKKGEDKEKKGELKLEKTMKRGMHGDRGN